MENTIRLNAYGYLAEICPEKGANILSLRKDHILSLRSPSSMEALEKEPFFMGTPMLCPPNRISGASFVFEGRNYTFPMNEPSLGNFLHGTLHDTLIPCISHTDREAVFEYRASKDAPYMSFPHAFTMTIRILLKEDGLHQQITVRNDSELNMPFALGFHTTFSLPITEGGRAEDVRLYVDTDREIVRDMQTYLTTGEIIEDAPLLDALRNGEIIPAKQPFSRHFEMGSTHEMRLIDPVQKVMVSYRTSEEYRYWMMFNALSPNWISMEPLTWIINCPNAPFPREETGFAYIKPGESRMYETMISLSRLTE